MAGMSKDARLGPARTHEQAHASLNTSHAHMVCSRRVRSLHPPLKRERCRPGTLESSYPRGARIAAGPRLAPSALSAPPRPPWEVASPQ